MSYGMNISASGLMTSIYAQEVWANNLTNMDTPGFKPDIPTARPRAAVTAEDGVGYLPSNKLLERLGAGALLNRNVVDFSQGAIKPSGNSLDLAIEGEGFFVVQGRGDAPGTMRLTRDGRFTRAADGTLVTVTDGTPVLDANDRPIRLGIGAVSVAGDGLVTQQGREVARLKMVGVDAKQSLKKLGKSQFLAESTAATARASGQIKQFAFEDSAADEVQALIRMTSASRDVEGNAWMIQSHDKLMERAINGLGRVT